eukprot:4609179-Pyramimonas_sp.AAC.1
MRVLVPATLAHMRRRWASSHPRTRPPSCPAATAASLLRNAARARCRSSSPRARPATPGACARRARTGTRKFVMISYTVQGLYCERCRDGLSSGGRAAVALAALAALAAALAAWLVRPFFADTEARLRARAEASFVNKKRQTAGGVAEEAAK